MPAAFDLAGGAAVPDAAVTQFERDGVICLRHALDPATVDALRAESDRAVADAGPDARFVNPKGDPKVFYYEFNVWRRYPVLRSAVFDSHLPDIAGALMRSSSVTLYYTNTFREGWRRSGQGDAVARGRVVLAFHGPQCHQPQRGPMT